MQYILLSDIHYHNWSAFSCVLTSGVNSRLDMLISETRRAAERAKARGIRKIIIAGDVFHVRGSVAPSVLNPVQDLFAELIADGFEIYIIAGNHDLEGKNSSVLGSAITSLSKVGCLTVSGAPHIIKDEDGSSVALVPWHEDIEELKSVLEDLRGNADDVVIHAPINDVIKGLPPNGLDPAYLQSLGFRNVFSGHYHNHKAFPGNVYSIGALAHHTWSDVGSNAGYLIVDGSDVTYEASHCPEFVELDSSMSEVDMRLACDGNYVKCRLTTSDQKELQGARKMLEEAGAKGVVLVSDPVPKGIERKAANVNTGMTTEQSVTAYVEAGTFENKSELADLCLRLLTEAGSAQ